MGLHSIESRNFYHLLASVTRMVLYQPHVGRLYAGRSNTGGSTQSSIQESYQRVPAEDSDTVATQGLSNLTKSPQSNMSLILLVQASSHFACLGTHLQFQSSITTTNCMTPVGGARRQNR